MTNPINDIFNAQLHGVDHVHAWYGPHMSAHEPYDRSGPDVGYHDDTLVCQTGLYRVKSAKYKHNVTDSFYLLFLEENESYLHSPRLQPREEA